MGEFVYCDFTKISCNGSVRTDFQYNIFKKEVMKRLEEKIDALTTKLQASYCNDVLVLQVTTYMHDDFVETSAILLKAIHLSRSCGWSTSWSPDSWWCTTMLAQNQTCGSNVVHVYLEIFIEIFCIIVGYLGKYTYIFAAKNVEAIFFKFKCQFYFPIQMTF